MWNLIFIILGATGNGNSNNLPTHLGAYESKQACKSAGMIVSESMKTNFIWLCIDKNGKE